MQIEKNIPLAPQTTIKLGGSATEFVRCVSPEDIRDVIRYAKQQKRPLWVLGGGSNTVFPDEGLRGVVARIDLRGISLHDDGDDLLVTAAAGEEWDAFVATCVARDCAGIEALSGIPGSVGATPIQNVGAYGQEVRDVIERVDAIDRTSGDAVSFTNQECAFGYRTSRFKTNDADRYIITAVVYRLKKNGVPVIKYTQLAEAIRKEFWLETSKLVQIRDTVILLRRGKSMIVDSADPNSVSCGSFFTNPILTRAAFAALTTQWRVDGHTETIPSFAEGEEMKVPAAWLIEHAGFKKGQRHGGVAISENHSLALVNRGGTTNELLEFAAMITTSVEERFGIILTPEPVVVHNEPS